MGVDPQWICVDLGSSQTIDSVRLNWEAAAAKDCRIQVSEDNAARTAVKAVSGNTIGDPVTVEGLKSHGRYVRIYCMARVTEWGYPLYEMKVFGP